MAEERVVELEDLLKARPDLLSPDAFLGKTIAEIKQLDDLDFFGSSSTDVAFILVFDDDTKSRPVAPVGTFAAHMPFASAIVQGLLTERDLAEVELRERDEAARAEDIALLRQDRRQLQKELAQFGLGVRKIHRLGAELDKVEQRLEELGVKQG